MSKNTQTRRAKVKLPRRQRFTIPQVIAFNPTLHPQTVRSHLTALLESAAPTLRVVGKERVEGRGRPRFVLSRSE